MTLAGLSSDRPTATRYVAVGIAVLASAVVFADALAELVGRWSRQEEYSHGFVIPLVTIWLLWTRRREIDEAFGEPSWIGLVLIVGALGMHVIGELSAFYLLSQLGFVISLMGITLASGGGRLFKVCAVPLMFLSFAIPLPYFIDSVLSFNLQLLSSWLGVKVIGLFGVPVYLEGNVIDLGSYKLQVVDACSGLRYLYPLLSLGFLAAYLFRAPFWQRLVVFLSTVPITVVMNSLRIGLVGLLVDKWGIEQAEGLLHLFEGWIIFLACGAMLGAEIMLFAKLGRKDFGDVFGVPQVEPGSRRPSTRSVRTISAPFVACTCLLVVGGGATWYVSGREEIKPVRAQFVEFPKTLGVWKGRTSLLEPQVEHALGLDDYLLMDYTDGKKTIVNLYVAYYGSQRQGQSPHSPIVCIPGGGWHINSFARTEYNDKSRAADFPFNRVVIEREGVRHLVYYWFVQRGRRVANEYHSKWYLLVDSIMKNRTDGALVRLTTPMYPGENEGDADTRLQTFIPDLDSVLNDYVPRDELFATVNDNSSKRKS